MKKPSDLINLCAAVRDAQAEVAALKGELGQTLVHHSVVTERPDCPVAAPCSIECCRYHDLVADRDRLRGLVERLIARDNCDCDVCAEARKALEGRDG